MSCEPSVFDAQLSYPHTNGHTLVHTMLKVSVIVSIVVRGNKAKLELKFLETCKEYGKEPSTDELMKWRHFLIIFQIERRNAFKNCC